MKAYLLLQQSEDAENIPRQPCHSCHSSYDTRYCNMPPGHVVFLRIPASVAYMPYDRTHCANFLDMYCRMLLKTFHQRQYGRVPSPRSTFSIALQYSHF